MKMSRYCWASLKRLAHGRLAGAAGLEPDGELERLLEDAAGAVIDLARPRLDAQGIVSDGADGSQGLPGEGAAQRRGDAAAVADDADVEVIADAVGLGALENEVLQQAIDGVGDAFGLLLVLLAGERLQHRAGLIDDEDETGGVGPGDFGGVRHGAARFAAWAIVYAVRPR